MQDDAGHLMAGENVVLEKEEYIRSNCAGMISILIR